MFSLIFALAACGEKEEDTAAAKTTPPAPVATGFFH